MNYGDAQSWCANDVESPNLHGISLVAWERPPLQPWVNPCWFPQFHSHHISPLGGNRSKNSWVNQSNMTTPHFQVPGSPRVHQSQQLWFGPVAWPWRGVQPWAPHCAFSASRRGRIHAVVTSSCGWKTVAPWRSTMGSTLRSHGQWLTSGWRVVD